MFAKLIYIIRFPSRIALGVLWVVSGTSKLIDQDGFLATVLNYQAVPESIPVSIADWLPALEVVLGLSFLVGVATGGAMAISMALLAVFVAAQMSVMYRGIEVDCGCFSAFGGARVSVWSLCRTVVLLAIIGFAWWR